VESKERPQHSPIGASSCERWWNCPGSNILAQTLPPSSDTVYTATGTVAHQLADTALKTYQSFSETDSRSLYKILEDEIGRSYVESEFEIEVTDEMVEAVKVYADYITETIKDFALQWVDHVKTEVQFDLTHIDPEAYGTCDCCVVVPGHKIIVIDYKHGQGHAVEVENNHQLLYYALGAYYSLPYGVRQQLSRNKFLIETVIVQPRAKHLHGPIRSKTYTLRELLDHEFELWNAIQRVRQSDPTLQTGPWCKFCPAKPVCPEIQKQIEEDAGVVFGVVNLNDVNLPEPATLAPEQMGNLLRNANRIIDWAKSIIALGTRVADNGGEIEGYKLVTRYGNRRWTDEKAVENAYKLEFGDDIYNKKLKSPAKIEVLLGKARHNELEPYYETPVTGKTLVPVEDGREAVGSSLENAFSNDFLGV
jgi:hypothetical protein